MSAEQSAVKPPFGTAKVASLSHRPKMPAKYRLSLDLLPDAKTQLENVHRKGKCTTIVEVFRKSLALYELVLDHHAAKGKVVLEHADGTRETLKFL